MENWKPLLEVWNDFCKKNPGLGLQGGQWSCVWLRRNHATALLASGAVRQAHSRRWLADADRFEAVAFDLLTGKQS